MAVYSVYVGKKPPFAVEAVAVLAELRRSLGLAALKSLRICDRYLLEGLTTSDFEAAKLGILAEPQVDSVYETLPAGDGCHVVATECLPGIFDLRADSCAQCIALMTGKDRPAVRVARVYILEGGLTGTELDAVKAYLINPVDSREASLAIPGTLQPEYTAPAEVQDIYGFISLPDDKLEELRRDMGLMMDAADLRCCREYFRHTEKRDPTDAELRVLDTYWSDHCRHTMTELGDVKVEADYINDVYKRYQRLRKMLYRGEHQIPPVTLMDIATIGARDVGRQGLLNRRDVSPEANACSVNIRIKADGKPQDWLLMFKNETGNNPTEDEPSGGAIRDPLAGRGYVYQAMRISGAGDPLASPAGTPKGKLTQRRITREAAAGQSAYDNQAGVPMGLVDEVYHPGYAAKRMEAIAVIGAVPESQVRREMPSAGDVVILLGGKTGRDGIGGVAGHAKTPVLTGARLQKGNAPEQRKLTRLFRCPEVTKLIKRCNDFGMGGAAVAIGELADGVGIRLNLDAIPAKYPGLSGAELAISESPGRMAVAMAEKDAASFIALAEKENLEAVVVAKVTAEQRMVMEHGCREIVNISREFLSSGCAAKNARAIIAAPKLNIPEDVPVTAFSLKEMLASLRFCSRKSLGEQFDATVGGGTVLLPYGGKYQATPAQVMAAKLPVPSGDTDTCSLMSWGFDPWLSEQSPYHGAINAVLHSVAKIIAAGGSRKKCWLSFQEYLQSLGDDPKTWGAPVASLLGALQVQLELQIAAIGGKDSIAGNRGDMHVPPTFISFAVGTAQVDNIVPAEFQGPGNYVYLFEAGCNDDEVQDFDDVRIIFDIIEDFAVKKMLLSAWAIGAGGTAEAVAKMCFGNRVGFEAAMPLTSRPRYGSFVVETAHPIPNMDGYVIGKTIAPYLLRLQNEEIRLDELEAAWQGTLETVFPTDPPEGTKDKDPQGIGDGNEPPALTGGGLPLSYKTKNHASPAVRVATPTVLIPVFPGTSGEHDMQRAFEHAGARAEILVVRDLDPDAVAQSVAAFAAAVERSQILAIPGGLTGGGEPDGAAKLVVAFMRNPRVREAIAGLLDQRDGLICGIGDGFNALVKLGLVPFGEMRTPDSNSPTLAPNTAGRYQAKMVHIRIASNMSPWLMHIEVGEVFTMPVSHSEGRFVADEALICRLAQNGQIATQYVDLDGSATMDPRYNPGQSACAIEGITSPDGRVFGKTAHCERYTPGAYRNMPGIRLMDMFKGAVDYFR